MLLDSVDLAVIACGADGRPTHISSRAIELMGMDLSGETDPETWIEQVCPRTLEGRPLTLAELPIVRALRGETVRDFDLFVRTARGVRLMTTTATPVCAREQGRYGAVAVFADVTEQRAREARTGEELRTLYLARGAHDALAAGRLLLYAQPIVGVATRDIAMSELLLRLSLPQGGVEGPADLLRAAEQHGNVTEIDEWVFEQAAGIAATGRAVSINVSAQTVMRSSFVQFAEEALVRTGAPASLITLELTETAVVSDMIAATRFAHQLEAVGCRFALDDFGTGYAALTYLKHLPISYLKIDRDFVRDLVHNGRSRAVVSGVVALARGFQLSTVAEGVEDATTLELLQALDVDLAQGFHLGRPAPISSSELSATDDSKATDQ